MGRGSSRTTGTEYMCAPERREAVWVSAAATKLKDVIVLSSGDGGGGRPAAER
jgi:hypothetical protein